MRLLIRPSILLLFVLSLLQAARSNSISVYLYLIEFENVTNDPTLEWMKTGLTDILGERLNLNPAVAIRNRADLEKIMNNRNLLLHQPRDIKNVLLLGKFKDIGGDVEIDMQLVNIANWEQIGQRTITGKIAEITELSQSLASTVETMMKPLLPAVAETKTEIPGQEASRPSVTLPPMVSVTEKKEPPKNKALEHSKTVATNMKKDLEGMEFAMDLALGRRDMPPGKPEGTNGEWDLELNMANEERSNPENDANTAMLVQVLDNLVNNPYDVKLNPPQIVYDKKDKDTVTVNFKVVYKLKDNLIRDMLTSLPYNALKQEGNLTIFTFNKDRFNFPDDIRERISHGEYLAAPVIQFFDKEDHARVVIADAISATYVSPAGQAITYIPTHHFSPLIDFTIGGWSLQVAMEAVDIPVVYQFKLPLNATDDLTRVKLKFVSNDELPDFIAGLH